MAMAADLPPEVDGTLDALLYQLRAEQVHARAASGGGASHALRERFAAQDTAALSRRLVLADAVRSCLERAVASKERALLSSEAREAAARAVLRNAARADAVVELAWRDAEEWQRRAHEAEDAQREALAALTSALEAVTRHPDERAPAGSAPSRGDSGMGTELARVSEQLAATQAELAAAEAELRDQNAVLAELSARLEGESQLRARAEARAAQALSAVATERAVASALADANIADALDDARTLAAAREAAARDREAWRAALAFAEASGGGAEHGGGGFAGELPDALGGGDSGAHVAEFDRALSRASVPRVMLPAAYATPPRRRETPRAKHD